LKRPCLLFYKTVTYQKKIRIKKPSAEIKISTLINYFNFCQNGKGVTIFYEFVYGATLHQHQINTSLQTKHL